VTNLKGNYTSQLAKCYNLKLLEYALDHKLLTRYDAISIVEQNISSDTLSIDIVTFLVERLNVAVKEIYEDDPEVRH